MSEDISKVDVDLLGLNDSQLNILKSSGIFFPPVSGLIEMVIGMGPEESMRIAEAGQADSYRIPIPADLYKSIHG